MSRTHDSKRELENCRTVDSIYAMNYHAIYAQGYPWRLSSGRPAVMHGERESERCCMHGESYLRYARSETGERSLYAQREIIGAM